MDKRNQDTVRFAPLTDQQSWTRSFIQPTVNPKRTIKILGVCVLIAATVLSLFRLKIANAGVQPGSESREDHTSSPDSGSNLAANVSLSAYPALPPGDTNEYVALCVVVKDMPGDLAEFFIHHYHHHGIRRFYLYDDASKIPLNETADYGIPRSAVTYTYIPTDPNRPEDFMGMIYRDYAMKLYRDIHTWMGFIDIDEYLEMKQGKTLVSWLREWETHDDVGSVAVNWIQHNSAGLISRPAQSNRKAFDQCLTDEDWAENSHTKSFVRTKYFEGANNPHNMATKEGTGTVGEHGDGTGVKRAPITHDIWALHHYSVKSYEQFLEKQQRGSASGNGPDKDHHFDDINNAPSYHCPEMGRYYP